MAFAKGKPYRVSVYRTRWGKARYSDPVLSRAKSTVHYRIVVYPNRPLDLGERPARPALRRPSQRWRVWKGKGQRNG